jgi:hypothetical protein
MVAELHIDPASVTAYVYVRDENGRVLLDGVGKPKMETHLFRVRT